MNLLKAIVTTVFMSILALMTGPLWAQEVRLRGELAPTGALAVECVSAEGEGCIDPPGPELGIIPAGGAVFRERDGVAEFGAEVLNVALPAGVGGSGNGNRLLDVCLDLSTDVLLCRIRIGRIEGVATEAAEGDCAIEEPTDSVPAIIDGDNIIVKRRITASPETTFNPGTAAPVAACTGFELLSGQVFLD